VAKKQGVDGAAQLTKNTTSRREIAPARRAVAGREVALWLSRVEQAFVTAVLPLGTGLILDVGKFNTPVGQEDNESLLNWNYSRSLIFTLAEPSYHSGLRFTYASSKRSAVSRSWVGADNNLIGGNLMRAFALSGAWQPRVELQLVLVYMGGLEHPPTVPTDPSLTFRNMVDFYVRWPPVRRLQHADPDGYTTGARQYLGEFSGTVEARGVIGRLTAIARVEYRHDTPPPPPSMRPAACATRRTRSPSRSSNGLPPESTGGAAG
jgi:hypothetical protein